MPIPSSPPCHACKAVCCRDTGAWPFACVLSARDLRQKHLRDVAVWHAGGSLAVLPYKAGRCVFLDPKTNLCRTFEDRPDACRDFDCTKCLPEGIFLKTNPGVTDLIKRECRTAKRSAPPKSAGA